MRLNTLFLALALASVGLAAACALPTWMAEIFPVPKLRGPVTDLAEVIPEPREREMEELLRRFEDETTHRIAVLTIHTLSGESIEDYSLRVLSAWQSASPDDDNRVLVTLVHGDKKVRIEVGYGLRAAISDDLAKHIIDHDMIPAFREQRFSDGLEAGLRALMDATSYDFMGTWEQEPGTLTYVNHDQRMKVTFPNEKWEVRTTPTGGLPWSRPTEDDPSYHVLIAGNPTLGLVIQFIVTPLQGDMTLDTYLIMAKGSFRMGAGDKVEMLDSQVTERNGRSMGMFTLNTGPMTFRVVSFKEEGRFTSIVFNGFEELFQANQDQFWAIIDSYEYLAE